MLFAVGAALGVAGGSHERVVEAVRDRLVFRQQLLVLDGIETRHRATALLVRLLEGLPPGHCLVTSRESIGIAGEVGYRLAGLAEPSGRRWRDAPAARLFVAAARQADAGFELAPGDRAPLAALVEAVEGLPLGLVLAASLARVLDPGGRPDCPRTARGDRRRRASIGAGRSGRNSRRGPWRWGYRDTVTEPLRRGSLLLPGEEA